MKTSVQKNLSNQTDNFIFPFFWQHGEDESILRQYMQVIQEAGLHAVCVESRPHPDFCGPKWWRDMDIILDEAKKRNMKVWILDDSHFPTGYANGAMKQQPEHLQRQSICYESRILAGIGKNQTTSLQRFMRPAGKKKYRDQLLCVTARPVDDPATPPIDLTDRVVDGKLRWLVPEGMWLLSVMKLSRNCGSRDNYINVTNPDSCRVLIDAVYEPHWEHYRSEFGKTIAGFFSDEPELGNGKSYSSNKLGTDQDLPWSNALEQALQKKLGEAWKTYLPYLWENDLNAQETARVRFLYMDTLTALVKEAFSQQIGQWCRDRGVEYIGHLVEDRDNHARTGGSLGHYFRGLWGQDMAGIDNIGGQVMPQGEDGPNRFMRILSRDGEFFHYMLGRLGPSLAYLDPKKKGRTMCEIFGNYGWAEGLRLERYQADHYMVNGVNRFVPHAFSPKAYPDHDCPPHFYAHGHNPQYRHFRYLMDYMNRICQLIDGGRSVCPVGVLYHAEAEWAGEAMLDQKVLRVLSDRQINADLIPVDAFIERESYNTDLTSGLRINSQIYKALVIPYSQRIGTALLTAIRQLQEVNVPVIFVDGLPDGLYDTENTQPQSILKDCPVVPLAQLSDWVYEHGLGEIILSKPHDRIRYLHYIKNGEELFYFINEGTEVYRGDIWLPAGGPVYSYNAWDNRLEQVCAQIREHGTTVSVCLEPTQSTLLIFGQPPSQTQHIPLHRIATPQNKRCAITENWTRRVCNSLAYPAFGREKTVSLPDHLHKEMPRFSGWAQYCNRVELDGNKQTVLEVTDAFEGVELFVNGKSAGVQITPPYRFDITDLAISGGNEIELHICTTLERERAASLNRGIIELLQSTKEKAPTGITGIVNLYEI